jgi:amino acid adenylation domain-containing protein/non-ribosomal peptide synthase protein (TIGR01720 family)
MDLHDLLTQLRRAGATLRIEGTQLRCTAPRGALTGELRAELAARRDDLLAFLQEAAEAARPAAAALEAGPRPATLPLSHAQQRLWFLAAADPSDPSFHLTTVLELVGPLDLAAFRAACTAVVHRHESLRTRFVAVDGRPTQVIDPPGPHPVALVTLAGSAEARRAEARRIVLDDALRPFDLATGPLIRTQLLALAPAHHVLAVTVHHIISDAWSEQIIVREIAALYGAARHGAAAALPPLPIQYADYAVWQRTWIEHEIRARQLPYWTRQLAGAPPLLALPIDHPRPAVRSGRGHTLRRRMPAALTTAIKALAVHDGATPFIVVLTGFIAVLARWSGEPDLVVGTDVANRGRPELQDLVGFLVNQLVLRISVDGDPTFRALLARVRATALAAYDHQDLPFEELVRALNPERSRGHPPIFQTKCVLQDATPLGPLLPGLAIEPFPIERPSAKLDLSLVLAEEAGGALEAAWEYSTDLFEPATIERLAARYERFLAAAVAAPDERCAALDPLDDAERRLLLDGDRHAAGRPDATVHGLVEAWAARTPDAVAVVAGGVTWSYAELDRRANQLAHHLRAFGLGTEGIVGVCLERSAELVVALLAILKAGGAYLPLDPSYPAERLAFMLGDSRAAIIVTTEALADELPAIGPLVVCVDGDAGAIAAHPARAPAPAATGAHLAYVLYTSGSTGRPKGVMIEHRSAVTYVTWCAAAYGVAGGAGAPVHSSISFDLTVTSLFGPLAGGSAVHLVPERDGVEGLARALRARPGFSLVKLTPSHLRLLTAQLSPDEARTATRALVIGGEALTGEDVAFWRTHAPDVRLINEYGPTETVVGCCVHEVASRDPGAGPVPIGRPIAGARLYVLDASLSLVGLGTPGELYIGGPGIARGYANAPARTAERFVPDPFTGEPGARLYRTGDRVRRRADGVLEFHGRLDDQVKIKGYRIEPAEIEAVLREQPGVEAAVVVARGEPAARRLVAFVVAPDLVDAAVLRARCRVRLPDYLVPAIVRILPALPRSANGKIDHRALPSEDAEPAADRASDRAHVAPRSDVERTLAEIWAGVLGRDRVGIDDNFFDLGGDSILVVQIASRAHRAGLQISPNDLFDHQTIRALAGTATAVVSHAPDAPEPPGPRDVPLTPIQRWFFESGHAAPHHVNQAFLLDAREPLDAARLEAVAAHLIARHDALRMTFHAIADGWRQRCAPIGPGAVVELIELAGVAHAGEDQALDAAAARIQRGFQLDRGPLLRLGLVRRGGDRPDRLVVVGHHLVVDGVSWRVLLDELQVAYRQLAAGTAISLPPRSAPYHRWAEALVERAARPVAAFDHWRRLDASQVTRLPADPRDPRADTVGAARAHTCDLDRATTRAVFDDVLPACGCRIDDVLAWALVTALGRATGGRRFLVGLEGHGRVRIADGVDVSRTVGWFTSIYPVVLDAAGDDRAGLDRVRASLAEVPDGGIDFGVLRYLGDPAAAPPALAPEVVLNYLGRFDDLFAGDALFAPSDGPFGPPMDPGTTRRFPLEVNAIRHAGVLHVEWTYAPGYAPALIERLAAEFVAALRRLVERTAAPHAPRTAIAALDAAVVEDDYPLVLSQQAMFAHTLAHPGSWAYFTQLSCRITGAFEPAAFEAACRLVSRRHPALRTSLVVDDPAALQQRVWRDVTLSVTTLDWRARSAAQCLAAWGELLDADRRRGFDLRAAPLLRITVAQLADGHHRLVWSSHHGMFDGWSTPLLRSEVFQAYAACRAGTHVALPPAPRFADLVAWVARQDPRPAEAFWRRVLAGVAPAAVPAEPVLAGVARAEPGYAEREIELPAALTAALAAVCRRERLTLATAVSGAWALALARWRATDEVTFGVTVAVRPAEVAGVEHMIGPLLNTLPCRVRVVPAEPALGWLRRLQDHQIELRRFGHATQAELARWCGVPGDRPLHDSVVRFENYPMASALDTGALGITTDELRITDRWPQPLALVAVPGDRLRLELGYQRPPLDDATAADLLDDVRRILAGLATTPGVAIRALSGERTGTRRG